MRLKSVTSSTQKSILNNSTFSLIVMKYILPILLIFFFSMTISAQHYSRVKIDLTNKNIKDLAQLGIEVDHGILQPNRYLINDFEASEIKAIREAGFAMDIQIEDVQAYYAQTNRDGGDRSVGECDKYTYEDTHVAPKNFKLGTMGGAYRYDELWAELDKMRQLYPNLITTYQPIDTFLTHEANPIRWLRISDNATQQENEPKVLYTSLHHAREVLSLTQLVYFMWYLLENYDKNLEIKNLIDHTELYFVPMVNPDGYRYNETNFPDGGGLWRKNRRNNGGGIYGVDLNRNYGYEWAHSDAGSSPNPPSEVYRGPAAFSEPETRAIRWMCEKYDFKLALNYHTFGNLLIYPWGYNDFLADPKFREIGDLLTAENRFKAGTGIETVAYNVNGNADDWMWGAQAIYSFTPEVSTVGFWPTEGQFKPLSKTTLLMNIQTAQIVGSMATLKLTQAPLFVAEKNGKIEMEVKRYGFDNQEFIVSVSPLSTTILSTSETRKFTLNQFEANTLTFNYTLKNDIKNGDPIRWHVKLTDVKNSFTKEDTITSYYGGVTLLNEKGENLSNWTNIGGYNWKTTTKTFKSAPSCITDSPNGNYNVNESYRMNTKNYISIPKKNKVILQFWTKWDIEPNNDYAAVSISDDLFSFQYICGKYTHLGSELQLEAEPIFDGKSDWVLEEMDITEYAGRDVLIRFELVTDFINNADGIYIDDIAIIAEDPNSITSIKYLEAEDFLVNNFPNPTHDMLNLQLSETLEDATIEIYNSIGSLMQRLPITQQYMTLDLSGFPKGAFYYQIKHKNKIIGKAQRLIKI
jgi:carboxypeptidase T